MQNYRAKERVQGTDLTGETCFAEGGKGRLKEVTFRPRS